MGDAVVSNLVSAVVGRLASEVIKEAALLWGLKNDISTLQRDFTYIQYFIQDAENKCNNGNPEELWLKSLRSVSLEVENLLDDISTEDLLQDLFKEKGIKSKVKAFLSSDHNKQVFKVRVAHKVKDIRRELDAINSTLEHLSLVRNAIRHVDVDVTGEILDRETISLIHNSSMIFGRDEEMKMVIEKICNKEIGKSDNREVRVYAIWGMGGLGKTTLAQLVYNHETVNQYFDVKCWVYVSENFQVKEIVKGIITSLEIKECILSSPLEGLQVSLQNNLKGKKFLIVLDDVWIENMEETKWEQLSNILSCGEEGSIVVTTTRSETSGRMMAKVPELQHNLECLSKEDSWLLFEKFAFAQGRVRDNISVLEPIGREIVEKCKGLPLAVKTLGSLMRWKSSTSDWHCVKNSNIWELEEINILLKAILKLSYDNLLPHMKRCFAYCCLFPKGYEMNKDVMIGLWVGNGFIPRRVGKDLYALGEEVFNCLVSRSFFQVVKYEFMEDRYKLHDLMHHLAQDVMGDDCLVINPHKDARVPNGVIHLSSSCPDFLFSPKDLPKLTSLRSILMLGKINQGDISQIFEHVYLRVLYLCGIELTKFPKSFYKLKHLKYLNLSHSSIKELSDSIACLQNLQYLNLSESNIEALPDGICYLKNLQVLLLYCCDKLRKLPDGLRSLRNLKHLDVIGCDLVNHLPLGIKELSGLRILSRFPVDKESGAKIEELGGLNLLEGSLWIMGLENVGGLEEAESANLKSKTLSCLGLWWERQGEMFENDEKVLEGLEPNPCLEKLEIYGYMGKVISLGWMDCLSNLVSVTFWGCKKLEQLPALGRFPNLRYIKLWYMDSLMGFHDEDMSTTDTFPSLQRLNVYTCPSLVSLPCSFPKLEVLELNTCKNLVSLLDGIESFKYLKKLNACMCNDHLYLRYAKEWGGVDWHKISRIPNIDIQPDPRYKDEEYRAEVLRRWFAQLT